MGPPTGQSVPLLVLLVSDGNGWATGRLWSAFTFFFLHPWSGPSSWPLCAFFFFNGLISTSRTECCKLSDLWGRWSLPCIDIPPQHVCGSGTFTVELFPSSSFWNNSLNTGIGTPQDSLCWQNSTLVLKNVEKCSFRVKMVPLFRHHRKLWFNKTGSSDSLNTGLCNPKGLLNQVWSYSLYRSWWCLNADLLDGPVTTRLKRGERFWVIVHDLHFDLNKIALCDIRIEPLRLA